MSNLSSVESSTLTAEAYTIVRQRILKGELAMGQTLSRRKLASEIGIGLLPISEALYRLELEGLLETRRRAGTRVRIPSSEYVRGQFVIREALEVQAAMLFVDVATAAERAEIRKLAIRVDTLSQQPDRTLFVMIHQRFHYRIAECTRVPALREALEITHALASMWYSVTRTPNEANCRRLHHDLADVLLKGDPEQAATAMRRHIRVGLDHTMEQLEPYFRMQSMSANTFFRSDRRLRSAIDAAEQQ